MSLLTEVPIIENQIMGISSTQVITSISNEYHILNMINKLEGFKTKLKELHWAFRDETISYKNLNFHKQVDELLSDVSEFQDKFAEGCQAIKGNILFNTLVGINCSCNSILDIIYYIQEDLYLFRSNYSTNKEYIGIINNIEDFYATLNKHTYLFKGLMNK